MRRATLGRGILAFVVLGPLGLAVHEAGHAFMAIAAGHAVREIGVFPGVILYPEFAWPRFVPLMGWVGVAGQPSELADGAIAFAGSAATWLVALMASVALLLAPHRLGRSWLLRLLSLYHVDGLTYTFLPLVGLRHWIVVGGATAEPLEGARALGIPSLALMAFALLTSAACIFCLFVKSERGLDAHA